MAKLKELRPQKIVAMMVFCDEEIRASGLGVEGSG